MFEEIVEGFDRFRFKTQKKHGLVFTSEEMSRDQLEQVWPSALTDFTFLEALEGFNEETQEWEVI